MKKFSLVNITQSLSHRLDDPDPWASETSLKVAQLPTGRTSFWGIPFQISGLDTFRQLAVTGNNGSSEDLQIPLCDRATWIVFAHFCDSNSASTVPVGDFDDPQSSSYSTPVVTAPGELLANYVLVFTDGSTSSTAVRRRFEVNQIEVRMQSSFAARSHLDLTPLPMHGPYPKNQWGRMQTGVNLGEFGPIDRVQPDYRTGPACWSLYALRNSHPEREISEIRIEPTGAAAVGIGAITLFRGTSNPLRHNSLDTLEINDGKRNLKSEEVEIKVDMGVVARQYNVPGFDPEKWLSSPVQGWGEEPDESNNASKLMVDISAGNEATLSVDRHEIDLTPIYPSGKHDSPATEAKDRSGTVSVRPMTRERVWIHARVIDESTGKPTPARVHFRSPDGRYFPPYGHRHEVNDNWFEDYGADLKLGSTQYAYVDGTFQVELPVGNVYAEVSKGFEFAPQRVKFEIQKGQRDLDLTLSRVADSRSDGWVTADSHIHFITPDTAWLEGQAEGLNLINLLAAQWGDLYTNVGDITGAAAFASRDDTIVWVGSENRQHFLGHISMLGTQGSPVFPMSTSGPNEGYFGDATWKAMSEWADECRRKEGVVVVPHFPFPHSEVIAEVIRGKVDGLELRDFHGPTMDTYAIHEWYRLLNCGYRVSAIGGTDKMSAGMPVGGVRTYARIKDEEFSFASWGRAVRAGRTYTTSGPLMSLTVEGAEPGDEIAITSGGGTVHVEAKALSTVPFHRLQVVLNGRVVADEKSDDGTLSARIAEDISITESCWIAARAVSDHQAWHVWPVHFGAHTSPVWIECGKDKLFDGPTAQYLVTVMEGGLTWLDTLAIPATPERHKAIRGVFQDGIKALSKRIEGDHSSAHGSHHGHSDHSHSL